MSFVVLSGFVCSDPEEQMRRPFNSYQIYSSQGVLFDPVDADRYGSDAHRPDETEIIRDATAFWQSRHYSALAHIVNHPPPTRAPNVISWPVDLNEEDMQVM